MPRMQTPRWLERWRARRALGTKVGIWYHPEYAAEQLAETARVAGVEPRRGELILGRLLQDRLLEIAQVSPSPMASFEDVLRFHTERYLASSEEPEVLGRIFGLEPGALEADALLRSARRATGGTMAAAEAAAAGEGRVEVNLGGGFHHAEPDRGAGFCVFNDVGVAIAALRSRGFSAPISIVDLDFHQGNGNDAAFGRDPSVFIYSIHGSVWSHGDPVGKQIHLGGAVGDRRYLACLETTLHAALEELRPRLVFYIAGCDVLAGDRLGSFMLSLEGVLRRDRLVIDRSLALGASVVVTMGGGYGRRAWMATYHLLRALLTGSARIEDVGEPDLQARFSRIARSLDPLDLQRQTDDLSLTEADLVGALGPGYGTQRYLDFYSMHGVELALERYGILPAIRARGFVDLDVRGDARDPTRQVLQAYGRKPGTAFLLLLELVARRRFIGCPAGDDERIEVLAVEWLLLQDPTTSFTLERPPLPGQEHPGLGIALEMRELLLQACRRVGLHGLLNRPAHYHNAFGAADRARFISPEAEGRFRAMTTLLAGRPIAEASAAVESGALHFPDGTSLTWEPAEQLLPVSEHLETYFGSEAYRGRVERAMRALFARGLALRGD